MAFLLALPDELLLPILACLSQADLATICRVHRRLHDIAEPYLYADVSFSWEEALPHPITSLLRSILRRPQLATYIRTLSLRGRSFDIRPVPKIPVGECDMLEAMEFVAETDVAYAEAWLEELENGRMDAYVAVLLAQPLRLTSLVIGHNFFKEFRLAGCVLRSTLCEKLHDDKLQLNPGNLKSVSLDRYIAYNEDMSYRNTPDVLPLFYLPSVEHISAVVDNPSSPFSWPAKSPPSPSSLRSLALAFIREQFLGPILSITDQLETFHYKWVYEPDVWDGDNTDTFDLTLFTVALSHVRNTLKELALVAVCGLKVIDYPLVRTQGSLSGLKDLDKLTRLTVPFTLLIGFEVTENAAKRLEEALPPSLEYLTLTDDLGLHDQYLWEDHQILGVFQRWFGRYQDSTPHLWGITLKLIETFEEWTVDSKEELKRASERVGIQLLLIE